MSRRSLLVTAFCLAIATGCGKTATEADSLTVSAAMGNIGNMAVTQSARFLRGQRTCTPSGPYASAGFTFTVTCPTPTRFNVVVTNGSEFTRTCDTTSFVGKEMTATLVYEPTATGYTLGMDVSASLGATAPTKSLSCAANLTVSTTGTATVSVSETGYACTLDGGAIAREKFAAVTCVL